jgi:hypothetical protein
MMDRRDAGIVARIDDVLAGYEGQRSGEVAPGRGLAGVCIRCPAELGGVGDFCGPCRAFLLGDSEHDPGGVTVTDPPEALGAVGALLAQLRAYVEGAVLAGVGLVVMGEDGMPVRGRAALELLERAPKVRLG